MRLQLRNSNSKDWEDGFDKERVRIWADLGDVDHSQRRQSNRARS